MPAGVNMPFVPIPDEGHVGMLGTNGELNTYQAMGVAHLLLAERLRPPLRFFRLRLSAQRAQRDGLVGEVFRV